VSPISPPLERSASTDQRQRLSVGKKYAAKVRSVADSFEDHTKNEPVQKSMRS
jgi:hypothetical protein